MISRFAGAALGLLAFAIAVIGGIYVQNPVAVTLSRGILALCMFCLIGLLLGAAAQMVVDEHTKDREEEIRKRYRESSVDAAHAGGAVDAGVEDAPTASASGAIDG